MRIKKIMTLLYLIMAAVVVYALYGAIREYREVFRVKGEDE